MKNILKITSKFILGLAFLNIFAYSVQHVNAGGNKLGIFSEPLMEFSQFPNFVKNVFKESKSSSRFINIDPNFQASNHLEYDLIALSAHYESSKWIISLFNLKNDSILHKWYLNEKDYVKVTDRIFSHSRPFAPILLEDRSLIVNNTESVNLYRLDRQSKIIWHNTDHEFHHSMNLDKEGNIWVCTNELIEPAKFTNPKYLEEYITKIDVENGNTLFNKSVREILIDNDLAYLSYGMINQTGLSKNNSDFDPLHLNDIEPVLKDGPYWKEGDLFISLARRSTILLYRPSTNRILRVIAGPFLYQHDIDLLSDSEISIFNNNVSNGPTEIISNNVITELQPLPNPLFDKVSNIIKYNFIDSTFTPIYQEQFIENKIHTKTEGLHHILSNGDMFVESQNEGKVYIINENRVLLKKYLNKVIDNQVDHPNWTRIYENINF